MTWNSIYHDNYKSEQKGQLGISHQGSLVSSIMRYTCLFYNLLKRRDST